MDSSRDIATGVNQQNKESEVSAALERLWVRFLPETRSRIEILETAAQSLATGSLSSDQRNSASSAAHKLAGTLGTFGLANGTALARQLEHLYAEDPGAGSETASRLAQELREMIEARTTSL